MYPPNRPPMPAPDVPVPPDDPTLVDAPSGPINRPLPDEELEAHGPVRRA